MHIAVAGNIGAGKTTLTQMLSKHYGWDTHFEDIEQNPYLNDFYEDMQRWSFNLQIYYLNSRFTQIQEIKEASNTVIQDRTIYEDAFVSAPDLLIYLRASVPTLVNHIQLRGREYEESIRLDYLKRLNDRYEAWISTYDKGKLLIIDIDNNRFPENQEDFGKIIQSIDAEINGLF
jgi:deoxyadenosine/deoxycytidine kinase